MCEPMANGSCPSLTPLETPGPMSKRWYTTDERGRWEHREVVLAVIECPKCGAEVECSADTVAWQARRPGEWKHIEYGPPTGECCGLLLVDNMGEAQAYELPEPVGVSPK